MEECHAHLTHSARGNFEGFSLVFFWCFHPKIQPTNAQVLDNHLDPSIPKWTGSERTNSNSTRPVRFSKIELLKHSSKGSDRQDRAFVLQKCEHGNTEMLAITTQQSQASNGTSTKKRENNLAKNSLAHSQIPHHFRTHYRRHLHNPTTTITTRIIYFE